jgi:hypothetical protein
MRPIILSATVAAGILYAAQAQAGGGGPTQLMPSQPWPTYCAFCFGQWQTPAPPPSSPPPPATVTDPPANAQPTRASRTTAAPK